MECALWLNRRKVFSASEISENLDAASLVGYFAAGSLVKWLREHNGADFADKLECLSPDDPEILGKIAEVFGGNSAPYKALGGSSEKAGSGAALGGSASFTGGLFGFGGASSALGSGAFGSFRTSGALGGSGGVFALGGSFRLGSFRAGSGFSEWEWEWERLFGSFSRGSFSFGSGFELWFSYLRKRGSFGSFGFGSFGMMNFGSFCYDLLGEMKNGSFIGRKLPDFFENLDEYDRIMLISLYGCPLNRFGYGIHNI